MGGDPRNSWDRLPVMLAAVDPEGRLLEANAAARHSLGAVDERPAPAAAAQRPCEPEHSWAAWVAEPVERQRIVQWLADQAPSTLTVQGGPGWLELSAPAPQHDGPRILAVVDVTRQRRLQEETEARCADLRRLLQLAQQDRQLIAHEIHDGLVQEMTAAQMFLEAGMAQLDHEQVDGGQPLEDAVKWLRTAIDGARRLMNGLRPPELDSGTVVQAIEAMAEHLPGDCRIEIDADDPLADLDPTVALSLFRIAQESLNNAVRHSGSERIRVEIRREEDRVRVTVQDWGAGFDLQQALGRRFGLKGMRQRATTFGGDLQIDTEQGQGTIIRATLPLLVSDC